MIESEKSPRQIVAIKRTISLARRLQKELPEIADLYRKGNYQPEIVNLLSICERYSVTESIARSAVGVALRGYSDPVVQRRAFNGLLDESELCKLADDHKSQHAIEQYLEGRGACNLTPEQKGEFGKIGGKIAGELAKKNRHGICGLSTEQRRAIGKISGKKSGKIAYEQKRGVHALTHDQRVANGKLFGSKAGRKAYELGVGIHSLDSEGKRVASKLAVIAQGKTPWKERETTESYCRLSEHEYAYMLSQNNQYQYQSGRWAKKPNMALIAKELNRIYHEDQPIRDAIKVQLALKYFKKQR
jgi:hypothetical protein